MKEEIKQCDVLCVGGGIAGLMAAIRAKEMGAKVIVAEKSNTLRSGCAGMGVDHFFSYVPDYHGPFNDFLRELTIGQTAAAWALKDRDYIQYLFENSFDMVKRWEEWGIPFKYQGKYEFAGHCFPGERPGWLKISGLTQKPVLTKQTLDRGVDIMNRVMVFDLLKNEAGNVIGAVGISTREDIIYIFDAKVVILGTGVITGLYPPCTPGGEFNRAFPLQCSGDGRAMAYRTGAELADLELTRHAAGPKYFIRAGQASWVGVLRDRYGKPVGPFLTKPDYRYGDMTNEIGKEIYQMYLHSGKGPIYMDMNGITNKDYEKMVYYLVNQGNTGLLDHIASEGIDLKKAAIEYTTYEMAIEKGILYNYKGETTVKGLYAAGDESQAGLGASAIIGWSAGENAAKYAGGMKEATNIEDARTQINSTRDLLNQIRTRDVGAKWQEAYASLQQIMFDYCGYYRSEPLMEAGLDVIRRFKTKARDTLKANSSHELAYCMQALNLYEVGEMLLLGANDRKETRGLHKRPDYPLTNPLLAKKRHVIKQVDGKPVLEWQQVKK